MKIYEYVLRIKDQATDKLRRLQATGSNAMGNLRSLGGQVRNLGSDLFNMGGLASAAARYLGPAVLGAALLFTGKQAITLASDLEQMTVGFEVMLGSAEKAQSMISDIRNMAKFTPFETNDLVKGAEILLGFGVAGEKIMPTLNMLGDVSRGNAEKLRLMSLAYAQMSAAGRLMGQDLLQMINAGFNPLQTMAEKMSKTLGITAPEAMIRLKKQMEDGKISTQMVQEAFITATSAGGRFFGMMDRQSKTYAGMMSTLRDEYKEALIDIGMRLLPSAIEMVKGLRSVLNDLTTRVDFSPLVAGFTDIWNSLKGAFSVYSDFFELIGVSATQINTLQLLFNTLALSMRITTLPLRIILNGFSLLVQVAKSAWNIFSSLGLVIQSVFTMDINLIKASLENAKNVFNDGFDSIKNRITDFVSNEYKGFKDIFNTGPKPAEGLAGKKNYAFDNSAAGGGADAKTKAGLDKISGGGKQHVNVTINLENLIGTQNFDVKNMKETVRDMEKQVVEGLLRVLNSSQYAASQ